MTCKVRFTPKARDQFLAALAYVQGDNPSAAVAMRQRAGESLSRLRDYPESGRVLPESPSCPSARSSCGPTASSTA